MPLKLRRYDWKVLTSLAQYRLLRIADIARLHPRENGSLRRRLHQLTEHGLIRASSSCPDGQPGRPRQVLFLSPAGLDALKARAIVRADAPAERLVGHRIACLEHCLLRNDLLLQFHRIEQIAPSLRALSLSPTSVFLRRNAQSAASLHHRVMDADGSGRPVEFVPDAVLALASSAVHKTVLFYLEVDMGTEPLVSRQHPERDIRQKLLNYRACFDQAVYKRYERIWDGPLRGFRLLFLVDTFERMAGLCRMIRQMGSLEPVWLTDRRTLQDRGVWAEIWVPAGRLSAPRESILGSQRPDPVPRPADLG